MKNKIVEISPDKRQTQRAWDEFKELVNTASPDQIEGALFYVDAKDKKQSSMAVFGPTWEMTGLVRMFLQDLETENYMVAFAPEQAGSFGEDELD